MKIDAFGGRLDVNIRQTKRDHAIRHSLVFKHLIYEAVNHNDQAIDRCSLMVVR